MEQRIAINRALAEKKLTPRNGYKFVLIVYMHGLYMRRCSRGHEGASVEHSINFQNEGEFAAWLASDKIVFDDPILHNELQRCANDLFAIRRSAATDA
jgi:hypothetical protein